MRVIPPDGVTFNEPIFECPSCHVQSGAAAFYPNANEGDSCRLCQRLARYHITFKQYTAMVYDQFGRCAICDREPNMKEILCVDHYHIEPQFGMHVRGLLCRRCNAALGAFGDKPEILERAAAYLEEAERRIIGHFGKDTIPPLKRWSRP